MKHLFRAFVCVICFCGVAWGNSGTPDWHLGGSDEGWKNEYLTLKYFHNSEMQRQWAWHLLGSYHFRGDERILDFGCGDGKITAELAHFIPQGHILGVDLSPSMINFAKRCFPSAFYPNVNFEQTDDVDFKDKNVDGKYDLICSFSVFHLVPNPVQILNNLKNMLTSDGKLLFVIPSGNNPALFQAANDIFAKYKIQPPWSSQETNKLTMRTEEGCLSCLIAADLEPISITQIHTPNAFYNKQELIEWMIGTVTANWQVPLDQAAAFFADLVDRMAEIDSDVIDESGAYHMKLSRIEVVAKQKGK